MGKDMNLLPSGLLYWRPGKVSIGVYSSRKAIFNSGFGLLGVGKGNTQEFWLVLHFQFFLLLHATTEDRHSRRDVNFSPSFLFEICRSQWWLRDKITAGILL